MYFIFCLGKSQIKVKFGAALKSPGMSESGTKSSHYHHCIISREKIPWHEEGKILYVVIYKEQISLDYILPFAKYSQCPMRYPGVKVIIDLNLKIVSGDLYKSYMMLHIQWHG